MDQAVAAEIERDRAAGGKATVPSCAVMSLGC